MVRSPVFDEVRAIGALEAKISAVVAVLEARFKSIPAELANRIHAIEDSAKVDAILPMAATVLSLDQFRTDSGL